MLGSTFIATETPEELIGLEIDNLDQLRHVSLEELITLDFELTLQDSEIKWVQGQPVFYEEEAGIAIFQVNPAALQAVLATDSSLSASHPEDIAQLRQFIRKNSAENIYELATF